METEEFCISKNHFWISKKDFLISIIDFWISKKDLLISKIQLMISKNDLLISRIPLACYLFLDIQKGIFDIKKSILDINKWFFDIQKSFIDINKWILFNYNILYQEIKAGRCVTKKLVGIKQLLCVWSFRTSNSSYSLRQRPFTLLQFIYPPWVYISIIHV